MSQQPYGIDVRVSRLERELFFWRILGLAAMVFLTSAFHSPGPDKEVRFASADGRQTVVLSAEVLTLQTKDRTLARLDFAPVGESEKLEAELIVTGGVSTGTGLSIRTGKDTALLNVQHLNFLQGPAMRASLSTDGLELSDSQRHARISLSTPDQGLGGVRFLDQQKPFFLLAHSACSVVTILPEGMSARSCSAISGRRANDA